MAALRQIKEQFEGELTLSSHGAAAARALGGGGCRASCAWAPDAAVANARAGTVAICAAGARTSSRSAERRMERALITQYEARVDELLERLQPGNLALAAEIARAGWRCAVSGHVKIANGAGACARGRVAALARP